MNRSLEPRGSSAERLVPICSRTCIFTCDKYSVGCTWVGLVSHSQLFIARVGVLVSRTRRLHCSVVMREGQRPIVRAANVWHDWACLHKDTSQWRSSGPVPVMLLLQMDGLFMPY